MRKIGLRRLGLSVSWAGFLLAGLVECGGTNASRSTAEQSSSGAPAGDSAAAAGLSEVGGSGASGGSSGAAAPGTCATPSADAYQPMWTPPSAPMVGACSPQQVSREWALCEISSAMFDQNACRAFDSDPANSSCLGCMFGVLGAPSLGAILILPGDEWVANRGGCIALLDGDSSATGCGAKVEAATVCAYTACNAACTRPVSDKDLVACQNGTASGACSAYFDNAACEQLPRYASCAYSNFADYFNGFADLFCVSGLPGSVGAGGEAGAGP
jgi:hypothetical protein